jgi:hypothetical protein
VVKKVISQEFQVGDRRGCRIVTDNCCSSVSLKRIAGIERKFIKESDAEQAGPNLWEEVHREFNKACGFML